MVSSSTSAEYLTPGQAANLLHVSPKTLNRWAHEGRVPCMVTLGGHRRFRRDQIEAIAQGMYRGVTEESESPS
jgi:excisionase family DNA binding protein